MESNPLPPHVPKFLRELADAVAHGAFFPNTATKCAALRAIADAMPEPWPQPHEAFARYQREAHKFAGTMPDRDRVFMACLGLAGEAGEVVDELKKVHFHAKPYDRAKLVRELGDVLWYVAELATAHGVDLQEVALVNLAKLRARHGGESFKPHAEQKRAMEDAAAPAMTLVGKCGSVQVPLDTPTIPVHGSCILSSPDASDVERGRCYLEGLSELREVHELLTRLGAGSAGSACVRLERLAAESFKPHAEQKRAMEDAAPPVGAVGGQPPATGGVVQEVFDLFDDLPSLDLPKPGVTDRWFKDRQPPAAGATFQPFARGAAVEELTNVHRMLARLGAGPVGSARERLFFLIRDRGWTPNVANPYGEDTVEAPKPRLEKQQSAVDEQALPAVYMTEAERDALPEYSHSLPTGTTIGKRWRHRRGDGWLQGRYVASSVPGEVGIEWSRIVTTSSLGVPFTSIRDPSTVTIDGHKLVDVVNFLRHVRPFFVETEKNVHEETPDGSGRSLMVLRVPGFVYDAFANAAELLFPSETEPPRPHFEQPGER